MPRKEELEGTVDNVRRRVRAAAAQVGAAAREQAEDAFDSIVEAAEDSGEYAHRYLRRQWKDRPVTVAATALGVGLLLGLLVSSGRR